MRKFLVALLILSVMGGVFAQEESESKGKWGSLSGEANLSTTINLLNLDDDVTGDPWIGMYGGLGTNQFRLTWDWAKDNWTVRVPLELNKDGLHTRGGWDDGVRVTYASGPLTLGVSANFNFNWTSAVGIIPMSSVSGGAFRFEYVEDNYKFRVRGDLFDKVGITSVGGWYKFSNDSELSVGYAAYETKWFRVSDVVLGAFAGESKTDNDWSNMVIDSSTKVLFPHGYNKSYASVLGKDGYTNWENATTGIAYRYFITSNLSAGIAFANPNAGDAMFTGTKDAQVDFVYSFLQQATLGVKFENEKLGISAMIGLLNTLKAKESFYVPVHAGVSFKINDDFKIMGDLSAMFGHKNHPFALDKDGDEQTAVLNIGLRAIYGAPGTAEGFWALLNLRALDLTSAVEKGMILNPWIRVGYNIKLADGDWNKGFDSKKENAIYAGADIWSTDLIIDSDNEELNFNVSAFIGYNARPLNDNLKLSAEAGVSLHTGFPDKDGDAAVGFGFYFKPSLEWMVIDTHGKIVFSYNLGGGTISKNDTTGLLNVAVNDKFKITDHSIGIAFKWSF